MSDTRIFDQLVAEFEKEGRYYGRIIRTVKPSGLSPYEPLTGSDSLTDTIVMEAIKGDEETPEELSEMPSEDSSELPAGMDDTVIFRAVKGPVEAPKSIDAIEKLAARIAEIKQKTNHVIPLRRSTSNKLIVPKRGDTQGRFDFFNAATEVLERTAA